MFDRFSQHARRSMGHARQEAARLRHDYIGPEHMLLGLLKDAHHTLVGKVLTELDLTAGRIVKEVEKRTVKGTTKVTTGQLPFTPGSKKSLERTLEESHRLQHDYIGAEHLFLGLLQDEGIAGTALRACAIDVEAVRGIVVGLIGDADSVPKQRPALVLACEQQRGAIDEAAKPALQGAGIRQIHVLDPDSRFCSKDVLESKVKDAGLALAIADPFTHAMAYAMGLCRASGCFLVIATRDKSALPRHLQEFPTVQLEPEFLDRTREELTALLQR